MSRAVLLFVCAFCALSVPARAEAQRVPLGDGTTYISVDERRKLVTIVIDGVEILRIAESGLIVTGDVSYSGAINDHGDEMQIAPSAASPPATPNGREPSE